MLYKTTQVYNTVLWGTEVWCLLCELHCYHFNGWRARYVSRNIYGTMVSLWFFLSLTHTYGDQGLIFYFSDVLGLEVLFSCQEFHIKESIYGTRVMFWCCLLLTNVTQRQRKFRLEVSFCLQIPVEAGAWGFISMISLGFQILFCYQKFNFKQIFLALRLMSEVSFCWLMLYKNKKFHIYHFCFSVCLYCYCHILFI